MEIKQNKIGVILILMLAIITFDCNTSKQPLSKHSKIAETSLQDIVPIYMDTTYSFEERATDLVSRMTLEEKQSQLINTMPAIPRLAINAYQVWGEALHGITSFFKPISATSFPNSVALGAAWDPELAQKETSAISDEARGSNYGTISGLTYWSPVVEPARDPRWGRNGESFSEDPFLVSKIASGFVKGFMGDDPKYYKSVPTAKHFTANNSEFNRHDGDSKMDDRDLHEYYLDPYRNLILKDKIPSIMTAYNRVNGIPVTANTYLVDQIVRKNWGMDGYITSDCGGVNDLYAEHKYVKSPAEATAAGLIAGVDCNCGSVYSENAIEAIKENLMTEAHIDKALVHLFTIRMKTGEFDPLSAVPYSNINSSVIESKKHIDLALEIAEKTPVLLKNEDNILPLNSTNLNQIALIGPKANVVELGPYSGQPNESNKITPLAGIQNYIKNIGADIEVLHSVGAGTASSSNLCQFTSFTIEKEDGTSQTYTAEEFAEGSSTLMLNTASVGPFAVTSIKNVNNNDWAAFENIDLTEAKNIQAYINVPGDGGLIEIRTGSVSGNLLATLDFTGMHTGIVRGTNISSGINQIGVSGHQKLFFIFKAPLFQPIDEETISMAKSADVALVFIGTDDRTSSEEADRGSLAIPGNQLELIKAVAKVNPNTVVVMQTVGMVEIESFKDQTNIPGIIWYGYNGQAQGTAIANILFGEVNPGGKLHFTWYETDDNLAPITEYHLRGQKGNKKRTYWYYDGPVTYEFGFGMSYTSFEYSNFKIDKDQITPNDKVVISVDVENTGDLEGDEIVQVYVSIPESLPELERPIKRLKGFQRVTLESGKKKTVTIEIDIADLWFWDSENKRITFDQGKYVFEIGASSKAIKGTVHARLHGEFKPELRTVVAERSDIMLEIGEQTQTNVTAALTDDSFYEIQESQISYESSNIGVASIDDNGLVTAVGSGTTIVMTSVTIDGITKSDTYPIKVIPNLNLKSIALDNIPLENFSAHQHGYSFLYSSNQTAIPATKAEPEGEDIVISIEQAEAVPGTTLINLADSRTGETANYAIYFGTKGINDDFSSNSLGTHWQWKNHQQEAVNLDADKKVLTIDTESGDIEGGDNDAKNILYQNANTDWTIETKITLSRAPAILGEQAGIVAFSDEDNFVKVVCKYSMGGFMGMTQIPRLEIISEVDGSGSTIASIPVAFELGDNSPFILKVEKEGSLYTTYYSTDGENYSILGTVDLVLKDVNVGLLAVKGQKPSRLRRSSTSGNEPEPSFACSFDYFNIESR